MRIIDAETARLRMSLETGDTASAVGAMRNLRRITEVHLRTTGAVGFASNLRAWRQLREAVHEYARRGDPSPNILESALPLLIDMHASLDGLMRRSTRIERVLAQADVAIVYAGVERGSAPNMPRIFWLSHAELARSVDRVFDEWDAYVEAGPVTDKKPGAEQASWSESGREELYKPAIWATEGVRSIPWFGVPEECASGGVALMLASESHRARFGSLPDTLEDLVERGVLDTLPADPYAPDGRYLYEPDDAQPLGYTLRSVLPDGAPSPRVQWIDTHDTGALRGELPFEGPGDWSLTPLTKESTSR